MAEITHLHDVFDADRSFSIDPIARTIAPDSEDTKTSVVQHDHQSEVFTFRLPKYIEGHDMTNCNRVEVHYLNIEYTKKKQNAGIFAIDDLREDPDDPEFLLCSWLISHNSTALAGSLNFVLRFVCIVEGMVSYSWNTVPYTGITVANSIYNAEVIEDYTDILEQWEIRLMASMIAKIEQTTFARENNGVNVMTITMADGSNYTFEVRNGDVTTEDKLEIAQGVLDLLDYKIGHVAFFVDTNGVLNAVYSESDVVITVNPDEESTYYFELEDGTILSVGDVVENVEDLDGTNYHFEIE